MAVVDRSEPRLAAFNIQVKLVEPGYPRRRALRRTEARAWGGCFRRRTPAFANPILAAFSQVTTVTKESDVAEALYLAAIDASGQLRFPAGPGAVALARSTSSTSATTETSA